MKMQDVMDRINNKPRGYRVSFEWKKGAMLHSDYFPEGNEPLIETECEAWELADRFARVTKGEAVNIYVVDHKNTPVTDYEKRKIENR